MSKVYIFSNISGKREGFQENFKLPLHVGALKTMNEWCLLHVYRPKNDSNIKKIEFVLAEVLTVLAVEMEDPLRPLLLRPPLPQLEVNGQVRSFEIKTKKNLREK